MYEKDDKEYYNVKMEEMTRGRNTIQQVYLEI